MKKVQSLCPVAKTLVLSIAVFFSIASASFAQEEAAAPAQDTTATAEAGGAASAASQLGDPARGKELFNTHCASCHKRYKRMTGPALHGVTGRHEKQWLYDWIHNSTAMVASGDAEAVAIFEEYNGSIMTPFPQLSTQDIDDILAYVEQPKPEPVTPAGGEAATTVGGGGLSTNVILGVLAAFLVVLIIILVLVNKTLNRFASESGVQVAEKKQYFGGKPIWKAFAENQFLVLVSVIVLMLAAGYWAFGWMMQIGVDQKYQPIQPIHFSHRIHAGENQIDCKYCHSSARTSKVSGVPSLNVCMNCHVTISEVAAETATEEYSKEYYDKEIAKLYEAVGWDPATQSYSKEPKPVKWVRVHNLPDFAYYNHSQHVSVAGIACQTCHGPVEEMEILYQFAPLTMGWCINCHRETNVSMAGNEYYEKIHEELAKKYGIEKLTVAQMGGIECGKCHY
jgi:cytochrome c2